MRPVQSSFEDFARVRRANIALIDTVDFTRLENIPPGFANNFYWQAGHLVTVQMSLLFGRAGQPWPIDEDFRRYFAKGTSPADFDNARPAFEILRRLLEDSIDMTGNEIERLANLTYTEPVTVTSGKVLRSSADAMQFLPIHEGMHLGMMTAMKKLL